MAGVVAVSSRPSTRRSAASPLPGQAAQAPLPPAHTCRGDACAPPPSDPSAHTCWFSQRTGVRRLCLAARLQLVRPRPAPRMRCKPGCDLRPAGGRQTDRAAGRVRVRHGAQAVMARRLHRAPQVPRHPGRLPRVKDQLVLEQRRPVRPGARARLHDHCELHQGPRGHPLRGPGARELHRRLRRAAFGCAAERAVCSPAAGSDDAVPRELYGLEFQPVRQGHGHGARAAHCHPRRHQRLCPDCPCASPRPGCPPGGLAIGGGRAQAQAQGVATLSRAVHVAAETTCFRISSSEARLQPFVQLASDIFLPSHQPATTRELRKTPKRWAFSAARVKRETRAV